MGQCMVCYVLKEFLGVFDLLRLRVFSECKELTEFLLDRRGPSGSSSMVCGTEVVDETMDRLRKSLNLRAKE